MMTVVSYGGGNNSAAMLVGLYEHGERPDAIVFADTGGEKPHTYGHMWEHMQPWLERVGFPSITIVRGSEPRQIQDGSLEGECLRSGTLPSKAYGWGRCSDKWKKRPNEAHTKAMGWTDMGAGAGRAARGAGDGAGDAAGLGGGLLRAHAGVSADGAGEIASESGPGVAKLCVSGEDMMGTIVRDPIEMEPEWPMDLAELFHGRKLAEVLTDETKWVTGLLYGAEVGQVCLIGAACLVTENNDEEDELLRIMGDVIEERFSDRWSRDGIGNFNDDPQTTFEDIQWVCSETDRRWMLR